MKENYNKIKEILSWSNLSDYLFVPMKYRFVDTVEVYPGREARGRKLVSSQDWYFTMHFPGNPVMPGVFLIEMIEQTGQVIISTMKNIEEKNMIFQGCKNMRMYNAVRPGDVLKSHVVMKSFKNGEAELHGDIMIERLGEPDEIYGCSMDFSMVKKDYISNMVTIPTIYSKPNSGEASRFDYKNIGEYIADPIEYLFVDSVSVFGGESYGTKNLSSQDWFFGMNSDNNPYMQAGFIMESIMQTGVLIVTSEKKLDSSLMMFQSCDYMRILDFVRPGDILEIYTKLISYRHGIAKYEGFGLVNNCKVCEMKFTLIVPGELELIRNKRKKRLEG